MMSNSKPMNRSGVSVVIPNYNGSKLLPVTLPTVYESLDATRLPYEIIVSDDASSDDSISFLQAHYPHIIILTSSVNSGFATTINKGIHKATYPIVLLLNSDVKLTPSYIQQLLPYFHDNNTFGVMGRIIGWDNDAIQDGAKMFHYEGFKIKTSYNYIPIDDTYKGLPTFYLSGANALVSREKILGLGGFNELFSPFYVEDVELSVRAWRSGWNCYYEHNAICRHKLSASIKSTVQDNYVKQVYNRNKFFFHALHLPQAKLFFWHIQVSVERFINKLLGKSFYGNAYLEYKKAKRTILHTRQVFENGSNVLSLDVVKKKYTILLKGKRIKIFKR